MTYRFRASTSLRDERYIHLPCVTSVPSETKAEVTRTFEIELQHTPFGEVLDLGAELLNELRSASGASSSSTGPIISSSAAAAVII